MRGRRREGGRREIEEEEKNTNIPFPKGDSTGVV